MGYIRLRSTRKQPRKWNMHEVVDSNVNCCRRCFWKEKEERENKKRARGLLCGLVWGLVTAGDRSDHQCCNLASWSAHNMSPHPSG
jgi:hypothetical protein